MKLLLLISMCMILAHTKFSHNDKKIVIEVDFNRITDKIKDFANKL